MYNVHTSVRCTISYLTNTTQYVAQQSGIEAHCYEDDQHLH